MRAYLLYSSSAHFLLLAALFLISRAALGPKKEQAYYIDFIGPSKIVTMEKAAAAEGAAAGQKAAEQKAAVKPAAPDEDDFSGSALPKPSILASGAKLFDPETPKAAAAGDGGTPLVMDSANFPYPWYITQVREALWNAWTERMPTAGSLRCTVKFTISRNGSVKGVSVEKSAGNRLFDNAAESAVQAAAPFPPLPDDFYEDRLTVHVEFKAMD
jgi:protein TonB